MCDFRYIETMKEKQEEKAKPRGPTWVPMHTLYVHGSNEWKTR